MDFVQDYAALLPRLLPPSFANPLLQIITTAFGIQRTLAEHLTPLLTKVVTQPDVATVLALLAIFYISLMMLNMLYRAVMFWVQLAFRLVFWGAIIGLGFWVSKRGPEGFVEDVQGLVEYCVAEYHKYSTEIKEFQQQNEGQIRKKARTQQTKKMSGWL
ncbi:Apq12 domain containing protein [Pyrenophora tritici-repentis]|nr:Apq12 domain containing protein [Pyrenophora tritici-repentis]